VNNEPARPSLTPVRRLLPGTRAPATEPARLQQLRWSKRSIRWIGLMALLIATHAFADESRDLATALMERLRAQGGITPQVASAAGAGIACAAFSNRETRALGYAGGHAFACGEAYRGEVLGAILSRQGFVRCSIHGEYVGATCFSVSICGVAKLVCV